MSKFFIASFEINSQRVKELKKQYIERTPRHVKKGDIWC
jgi:hypothetical protein